MDIIARMIEGMRGLWLWTTRGQPVLVAALITVIVAVVDYLTGTELRLFPLYFVPLSLVAGSQNRATSVGASLILCGVWASSNVGSTSAAIYVGNVLSQFCAFLFVALLVNAHKTRADQQHRLASIDALTGLLNSRAFVGAARREWAAQKRRGHVLTMAYLDVDDFKRVNTVLGHVGADEVLKETARVMEDSLRQSDIIGRVGGDEFAILLPEASPEHAHQVLERLRSSVVAAHDGREMTISVSVGAVVFTKPAESIDAMLALSDTLMYRVKGRKKNAVEVCPVEELLVEAMEPSKTIQ